MAKDSNKKEEKVTKSDENKKKNKNGFKDFKAELKKVSWPTPKELANSTVAVITIVIITAIIVFVLDLAFDSLNTYGIDKIRSAVSNSVQSSDNQNSTNNSNDKISTDNKTSEDNTNNTVATNENVTPEAPETEGDVNNTVTE